MKVALYNASAPHYNLGLAKLGGWLREQGHTVEDFTDYDKPLFLTEYELVCFSVIFSWDAPRAAIAAQYCKNVWAGGPGLFRLAAWWKEQTGHDCVIGLDQRFERQRGSYRMTFASRGCPVNCHFCIVTPLEGKDFTLDYDFSLAPILCDNNISALPVEFQEHIIQRYGESSMPLLDANSGFEPKYFDEGTYQRWKPILKGPWRYAFDILPEWRNVHRVCEILKTVNSRKKRIYVLIGNEPIEVCYERVTKVLEWGGEPHCQPEMALDALSKSPKVRHDWTAQKLQDFARFFNRWLWRKLKLHEYKPRQNEPEPFRYMAPALRVI